MAGTSGITGLEDTLAKLQGVKGKMIRRVADAVDTIAIRIANHAKAGHTPGQGHAAGRYENKTSNLTNSIMPTRTHIGPDFVEAVIEPTDNPMLTKPISAIMEYGPKVEMRYPFMQPAETAFERKFKQEVNKAIHGNV